MNKNRDITRINIMINNIDFCLNKIEEINDNDFYDKIDIQYSLCMALQIICENANHLSNELKEKYNNVKWREMVGTRNIISHDYGTLNLNIAYSIIKNDLPVLKINLEEILEDLNANLKEVDEIKSYIAKQSELKSANVIINNKYKKIVGLTYQEIWNECFPDEIEDLDINEKIEKIEFVKFVNDYDNIKYEKYVKLREIGLNNEEALEKLNDNGIGIDGR